MSRQGLVEKLERRLMLSATDPSGDEQQTLELINRMRQNPAAELPLLENSTDPAVKGAFSFFNVNLTTLAQQWATLVAVPPLAWNSDLAAAALGHDQLMETDNDQSHQLPGEMDLPGRATAAGYTDYSELEESIFIAATSVFDAHAAFAIDWGDNPPSGIQNPPGHRENLMSPDVTEMGIAFISGPGNGDGTEPGPLVVTEDFGARFDSGNPFVLGSVFNDNSGDGYYESGEGVSGVSVQVSGTGGTFDTTTLTAGGYQIQVPAGTYSITFSGGSLAQSYVISNVVVTSSNVERDLNLTAAVKVSNFVFAQQPTTITAGTTFSAGVTVDAVDEYGDIVPSYNGNVTLGGKVLPPNGSFQQISVAAVNGVATFSTIPGFDLSGGYKLKATQTGVSPGKSSKFFVNPAAANKLVFVQQPTNLNVEQTFSEPITVWVEDQFGNLEGSDNSTQVALELKVEPTGASLDDPETDVNGVVTFSNVPAFTLAGGYKFKAVKTGLLPGKSSKFFVFAVGTPASRFGSSNQDMFYGVLAGDDWDGGFLG